MIRTLILAIACLISLQAHAHEPDRDRARQLLIDADKRFDAAVAERAGGNSGSAEGFLAAARAYESVAAMGFKNHAIYGDAGNAYLLAGDLGRAVLSFRRADLLRPNDPVVRDGLAQSRAMVQVAVKKDRRTRAVDIALAWRPFIPRSALFVAGLVLYAGAWAIAVARLLSRGRVPRWIGVACAIGAGVIGSALLIDHRYNDGSRSGVVIADGVTARNGPSSAVYAPTFTTPLRAGVELLIIEFRDDWYHVELADGRRTWLPSPAIELVEPAPSSADGTLSADRHS